MNKTSARIFLILGLVASIGPMALSQDQKAPVGQPVQGVPVADSKPRDRNILWKIVDNCLENKSNDDDYCEKCIEPLPTLLTKCDKASSSWDALTLCKKTLDVWENTSEFVALKDQKMCGCTDQNFVHGLVLPLTKVTGIEDVKDRPKDIWQFAWDEAVEKIDKKETIVLVANPRSKRTQDQLHIHIVRLADGARNKLNALEPRHVKKLDDVWTAATRHASDAGLSGHEYGIAVAYDPKSGEFLVVTVSGSAEERFAVSKCPL